MNNVIHTCLCGCDGQIEIKEHHKWRGVPLYIHGHNKGNAGKLHSDETKQKMKKAKIGYVPWSKGKKFTEEHIEKIRQSRKGKKRSEEAKLKTSLTLKEGYKNGEIIPWAKGKPCSEETRQKIRETHDKNGLNRGKNNPMYGRYGELSGNWQGGISFEPYPSEFNKELKDCVKNRDMYMCQTPNCMETENLDCHHIDYDKQNNNPENLVTLCDSCHGKTHFNRPYWTNYYQEILNVYL